MGMIAAALLSEKAGYLEADETKRIRELIRGTGLPVKIPNSFTIDTIISQLRMDKKKKGGIVHFVLLKKIGMPFVNGGIEANLISEVIEEMKK